MVLRGWNLGLAAKNWEQHKQEENKKLLPTTTKSWILPTTWMSWEEDPEIQKRMQPDLTLILAS